MDDRVRMTVDGGIADVRLARPAQINAIDPAMFAGLAAAIAALQDRRDVRCVVLSGEGRGFCAGLDMAAMTGGGSEERRVGKECPYVCRSRGSPYH